MARIYLARKIDWSSRGEVKEYFRNYYYNRRATLYKYIAELNNKPVACFDCGKTYRLEIDHIDKKLKTFNIKSRLAFNERMKSELANCQILCVECHTKKTAKEQKKPITHGSIYAWSKLHCNCRICLDARSKYRKGRRGGKADSSLLKSDSLKESVGANPTGGTND